MGWKRRQECYWSFATLQGERPKDEATIDESDEGDVDEGDVDEGDVDEGNGHSDEGDEGVDVGEPSKGYHVDQDS